MRTMMTAVCLFVRLRASTASLLVGRRQVQMSDQSWRREKEKMKRENQDGLGLGELGDFYPWRGRGRDSACTVKKQDKGPG